MVDRVDHVRSQLTGRQTFAALVLGAALVLATACSDRKPELPSATTATQGEGGSPHSLDSALALFRVGLAPMTELEDAERSINAAVTRFARMLEERDTAAMRAMVMTRREYAYLYYPTSPFTRAPTRQEPGLNWYLHITASRKGATRLLERYGGKPLPLIRNSCKAPPRIEGENRMWDDCVQTLVVGSDTTVSRLFGGIYERNGRFKIFSYSGDL